MNPPIEFGTSVTCVDAPPAANESPMADLATAIGLQREHLLRVARSRVRDATLAEDVVQDALLAALRPGIAFAEQSSLRTWLTGILINKIGDAQRRAWRRGANEVGIDHTAGRDDDDDDAPGNPSAIDWHDPERVLQGRQALRALHAGMATLAPRAARALELRDIEGWPHDDVARELGLSPAQCSVLLHRARARLRRELASA